MSSTDKFVGFLVSVECRDFFYQGIVTHIDPNKALLQLKNVFQNGIHCGAKLVDIKTTDIENIEIIADPQDALKMLQPKASDIEQSVSLNKLTDETNKLAQPQQQQITFNSFAKPNDNNNNHINNNKNSSSKVSKHAKTSNQNSHNKSNSNISPASVSPPYYQQNDSNKRKTYSQTNSGNYSNGHSNNSSSEINPMNVDPIEEDFDFEQNLALFDKNKFYNEVGHPILNNSSCMTPNDPKLNAYDSLVKQLNSNKQAENKSSSSQSGYRQISVANLFGTTPQMPAPPVPINGLLTPNSNGLLASSTISMSVSVPKTPNLSTSSSHSNNSRNYRFDEMVLGTGEPVNLQQIQVPCNLGKNYVTDDGFVVPCIDIETRQKLFEQSYKYGFTKQRQIECMGRCCTEMAIQLIGGPLRFSPKNNHQKPAILILVNENSLQGSYALLTARFLSIRSCKIHIYIAKSHVTNREDSDLFKTELSLFQSTDLPESTFLKNIDDMRAITSPDLIINSLNITSADQSWFHSLVKYLETCKASVLSIDPVAEGTSIKSKWCVLPVLPKVMSEDCGRVYLCDLGFTKKVFTAVNIKYQSPFGAKFLIPLHND